MNPPNLKALYGARFRITFDEAAEGRSGRNDRWMMQIPFRGRGVVIYPHGGGLLAVQCDRRPAIARRLAGLGLRLVQDGDHEKTFVFAVEMFEKVAAIVKPRTRRQVTPSQLSALLRHQRRFEAGAQKLTLKRAESTPIDPTVTLAASATEIRRNPRT